MNLIEFFAAMETMRPNHQEEMARFAMQMSVKHSIEKFYKKYYQREPTHEDIDALCWMLKFKLEPDKE